MRISKLMIDATPAAVGLRNASVTFTLVSISIIMSEMVKYLSPWTRIHIGVTFLA
jgi:hypothetical protein